MGFSIVMLLLLFFAFPAISSYSLPTIKSWCAQTPYPQPCEYYLTKNPKYGIPIKGKSDFLKLSLQLALDHSTQSKTNAISLGSKCRNEREKAAWSDCVTLYEDIPLKLNKTVDPSGKFTSEDVQTWLSAASTNLETCKQGFVDLGASDNAMPSLYDGVLGNLISNALATNKGYYGGAGNKDGFPGWVSPGDRKLLQSSAQAAQANIVVAQDGSGNYRTVNDAVAAASKRSGNGRFVIYVKAGTYSETVSIGSKNIMLVGDGIGKTIITGRKSVGGGGSTTYSSATVGITGDGFLARGITFRNTAGAKSQQAVAFRSASDLSAYYQCSFEGYQDTLYVFSQRQFYSECDIYGTVDFIFGNAAVVFQNCSLFARNTPTHTNTLTAQGRTDPNQNTGISIYNCKVTADSDLKPVQSSVKTYLGRPWKQYSRTVFMKTFLDSLIAPAGWLPWSGSFALTTLYYGEYMNTGPGSSTANRVKWPGYHVMSTADASKFTVRNFISGNSWIPATNVPFTSNL
ncbi:unnamed protein product [Coffea canephora]|uniref:Pectinesterase n=2 Tax=Coffea TaxID=13442 RepID=A0A068TNE4_COFCA|nr:pectinesterase 2-like [Coffea arabica]CDO97716.1 unnamed protein product [Coffea canephora]